MRHCHNLSKKISKLQQVVTTIPTGRVQLLLLYSLSGVRLLNTRFLQQASPYTQKAKALSKHTATFQVPFQILYCLSALSIKKQF